MSVDPFKLLCITKRWQHHSNSSGYDQLSSALGATPVKRWDIRYPSRLGSLWDTNMSRPNCLLDYRFEDWLSEWRTLLLERTQSPDLVHVLYGDEQLNVLLKRRRWLDCPLVSTFHLPVRRVSDYAKPHKRALLRTLDAAYVVSSAQLDFYRDLLGDDRVAFVPHGIDTKVFCPETFRPNPTLQILTVGEHMRDIALLIDVARQCRRDRLNIEFTLIGPMAKYRSVQEPNIRVVSSISESQLLDYYRSSDALFLPLTDCTANNSLLEALACGTPVLATQVGGVGDYLDERSGWFLPIGDRDFAFERIRSLEAARHLAEGKRASARAQALEFSWERVAALFLGSYRTLVHNGSVRPIAAGNV